MPLKSTKTQWGDIFDVSATICRSRDLNRVCWDIDFCVFAEFGYPAAVHLSLFDFEDSVFQNLWLGGLVGATVLGRPFPFQRCA
jgi:hypothetical protein